MVERRDGLRLAVKPREAVGIAGRRIGQDLDRHAPIEFGVVGKEHLAHPAGAEQAENLVRTEAGANGERHGWRSLRGEPRRCKQVDGVPRRPIDRQVGEDLADHARELVAVARTRRRDDDVARDPDAARSRNDDRASACTLQLTVSTSVPSASAGMHGASASRIASSPFTFDLKNATFTRPSSSAGNP